MALISLQNVSLAFGGPKLLDNVSLQVEAGDRICLLGRNGSGKSTLLRLLNNTFPPDGGNLTRQQGLQVALVDQEVPSALTGTVANIVARSLSGGLSSQLDWQDQQKINQIISHLSLDAEAEVSTLSGGLKRRVLLASSLAGSPDLLLLDEPTNHLDIASIQWLEDFLLKLNIPLIFVSHDRMFARRMATRIIELDRGHLYDFRCDYESFLQRREELLNTEQKEWDRFDQKLAEEEIWIRKGIKARRTRNMGRVRSLISMREERMQRRERIGQVRLQVDHGARSGQVVIEAENIDFSYPQQQSPVIENFSARIMRGDRIGVIGPNGVGKSTLLKILLGQLKPNNGFLKHGTNLSIAYFDQLREQLEEEKTVQENISGDQEQIIIGDRSRHVIGYLQDFLFTPDRARSPVKILSGGERNRLLLARLFTSPANLLVFDEPTNDLDIETLDLLEELLLDYQGTVLLVSHDRAFLNNVVTSCLVFEENGQIRESIGGYDDWLSQKQPTREENQSKLEKREKPKRQRTRRLSYKEKQELEELPKKIEVLETEQAELHETMADPNFYQRGDGIAISGAKERLEQIETKLVNVYQRWEELEQIPE